MKTFPGDFRLPDSLAGFTSCLIKDGLLAVCGGSDGKEVKNNFHLINLSDSSNPKISEMPHMLEKREEFALVVGADQKLYAIGGLNTDT